MPDARIDVPTGYAEFPRETRRRRARWPSAFFDIRRWTVMPRGGHFAALEVPDLLAEDIAAFFRSLRQDG